MALASNVLRPQRASRGLVRDSMGHWVQGFATHIGTTSSFLAELWTCREGLKLACQLGIDHLILEMDSLLVVQMIQDRKGVEGPATVLFADIFGLLSSFSVYFVNHTLREGNFTTDFMASLGHGLPVGATYLVDPPAGLNQILQGDTMGTMFLKV
ncbi:hypothetical protein SLEP1_g39626 [Rubroshorea leprosula]|uniref:RNase H type-1 domain-containing protein n=1 Tax=Rubroshorea leprosula TaxID=152421 RepID=A0AAV5L106_9ROSI|nr:hypothetical protein SLEP1_g39626 [Rubroshorea leprosula]